MRGQSARRAENRGRVTPADLRAWQAHMGISGREAARRLGVAPGTYQDWVTGTSRTTGKPIKISRLVALACAAIAAGIDPPHSG